MAGEVDEDLRESVETMCKQNVGLRPRSMDAYFEAQRLTAIHLLLFDNGEESPHLVFESKNKKVLARVWLETLTVQTLRELETLRHVMES